MKTALAVCACINVMRVQAFLSTPQLRTGPARPTQLRTGPAYAGEGSSDDDDDTRPTERLEPAADESRDQRALLERLALKTSSRDAEDDRPARPSSGTARRRRTEERKLVEVLGRTTDGEQFQSAIDGLWQLWFSERGAANKAKLEAVDALLQGGDLAEACAAAEALCAEHGDWTEARNRLATIQFLRGDYEASIGNCERVLAAKPHHFGALSGICMCHKKLDNAAEFEEWMGRVLPSDPDRRRRWADRAIRALDRQG
mmetsp:Transcript_36183/g.111965  ORF Transcript_36183/g.111965 Transcript_36183/m.111965 type:complete len:258 (+) Transcript_36183:63-836(+)